MKQAALCFFFILSLFSAKADEIEYALELGLQMGETFYLGDANYGSLYKNSHVGYGIIGRYNINARQGIKFSLATSTISGDTETYRNNYPQAYSFSNKLWDISAQYELGFCGYGLGNSYKGYKRLAPFIGLGLGLTACNSTAALNMPISIALRYKLKERWNIGLDLTMHICFSDKIDGIEDPYTINSGFLKNKDSYATTMLYISYDLCPKYRKCNN